LNSKLRESGEDNREAEERYEKLESAWSESIEEIEERRKALDARELELKEAEFGDRAVLIATLSLYFWRWNI